MDFKDWKKVDEDGKTVTMQHPKGHMMKIAVKALPKIQQEQIKRLPFAKGGDVLDSGKDGISTQGQDVRMSNAVKKGGATGKISMDFAKDEARGRAKMERHVKPNIKGLKDGGKVCLDEGGKVPAPASASNGPSAMTEAAQGARKAEQGKSLPSWDDLKNNLKNAWDAPKSAQPAGSNYAGTDDPADSVVDDSDKAPPAQAPVVVNVGTPAQAPAQTTNPAVQFAQAPTNVAQPQIPQARQNLNANGTMNPSAVAENTQTANQAQQNINVEKGKADAYREAGYVKGVAENQQRAQDIYQNYASHVDDASKAIREGLINPKHYQESMGTGAKVATAFGLMFGGLGSAFGGHNYAMDFLNKQIDRDIAAQRDRSDQQKTILGAYQQLYGEGVAANNATKATMLDIYTHKGNQIAAQLGTAQAAQAAMQFGANSAIEKSKLLQEGAVDLNNLPGTHPSTPAQPGQAPAPAKQQKGDEWSGSAGSASSPKLYTLLDPKAKESYANAFYTPKLKEEMAPLLQQFTQAQQVEKVLNGPKNDGQGGIHDIMQKMYEASKRMGAYGHVHREGKEALGALPLVGSAAAAATNVIPQTTSEKEYNGTMSALEADMGTALQGLMTPTDIHNAIRENAPAYLDEPSDVHAKEQRIVNQITKAARTSLLERAGMLKKGK